jgi:hypothetical protein
MSKKKPPSGKDQKPGKHGEGRPAGEAPPGPPPQGPGERAADALLRQARDEAFMRMFNDALDRVFNPPPPAEAIDLAGRRRGGPGKAR